MIQILTDDIDKISSNYFEEIKNDCISRSKFLLDVMDVILGGKNRSVLSSNNKLVHWQTKKWIVNRCLRNKLKKKENIEDSKVNLSNSLGFIRANEKKLRKIFNHFSDEANLKETVLCGPKICYDHNQKLMNKFEISLGDKKIIELIKKVLEYKIFTGQSSKIANQLEVNTCPYCNRIYTHIIFDNDNKKVLGPNFDHFYPQSLHPFLGMSFYNLIPSCYYCNANLKLDRVIKPDTHLHPFIQGFDNDYFFHAKLDLVTKRKRDPENYTLTLQKKTSISDEKLRRIKGNNKNEGNLNLFKLEEVYNVHRDIVGEIWVKCDKYSSKYSQPLINMFGKSLHTDKAEFYQFYFGNYLNKRDFNRRPLAKLTYDLVRQILPNFIK